MKSSFVFFLLLCSMAVCQIRQYVYISKAKTWPDAQTYCRENYGDLATITTDEEGKRLLMAAAPLNGLLAWIGLNRTAPGINIWQWSDGEQPNFFMWRTGQPDNWSGAENCGMVKNGFWNDDNCKTVFPFYCSWRFVLVKENKTWEEALDYCRKYYTGLANPISLSQLTLAENATSQTQTVSIWTGLCFMNGPLVSQVSLPSCPAPCYRCGARNTQSNLWENRDCSEKLNFLCY